ADDQGGRGGDGEVGVAGDAAVHLHRQGAQVGALHEQRDDDLVEAGDEGEQGAGGHAGGDHRQGDGAEGGEPAGAHHGGGLLVAGVEAAQGGGDRDDDEGQRQHGVGHEEP